MIIVNVRSNGGSRTVNAEMNETPASVFESLGIELNNSSVSLGGVTLKASEVNSTFENLNITDGTTIRLTSVVKGDGASK